MTYNCAKAGQPRPALAQKPRNGNDVVLAQHAASRRLFGAWVGIPFWLTFKHPASRPGFSAADMYLGAKTALAEDEQPPLAA